MRIVRDGKQVGVVNLPTAELHSTDIKLNELWDNWVNDGFQVLGPPPKEPPPGVFADAIYTIRPAADNLGLVAIELGNNGYELEFE